MTTTKNRRQRERAILWTNDRTIDWPNEERKNERTQERTNVQANERTSERTTERTSLLANDRANERANLAGEEGWEGTHSRTGEQMDRKRKRASDEQT